METNTVKQEMSLEDKKKALAQSGIIVGAVLLLCYFFGFSYIWNTSYGSEASVIFALVYLGLLKAQMVCMANG